MRKWFLTSSFLLLAAIAVASPGPYLLGENGSNGGPYSSTLDAPALQMRKVPNDFWYNNGFKEDYWSGKGSGQAFENKETMALWHLGDGYLDMERAWGITTGSDAVQVAVIDQEIAMKHYDMIGNLWYNEADPINGVDDDGNGLVDDYHGWDFKQWDPYPWASADDGTDMEAWYANNQTQHGTQMASFLGAQGNNEPWAVGVGRDPKPNRADRLAGSVGVVWDVGIIPLRTILGGDVGNNWPYPMLRSRDENTNRAAEYLAWLNDHGANIRVASMSYLGQTPYAISVLLDAGILPVAGAGNGNNSTPGSTTSSYNIAAYNMPDSLVAAAGVRPSGETGNTTAAESSTSFGAGVTVSAYVGYGTSYGNNVAGYNMMQPGYSDKPSMFTLGFGYADHTDEAIGWKGNMLDDDSKYLEYHETYGIIPSPGYTSGATAQTAGVAALLFGLYPDLSPLQGRELLMRGCITDIYDGRNIDQCASGDCAGMLGAGRLSAYRTLTLWGAIPDTTLSGDIWISGDVSFANVTIASGSTVHIGVDDIYEDEIDDGVALTCRPWDAITATIDNDPNPSPNMVEVFVNGVLTIEGPVTFKPHAFGSPDNAWSGIYIQTGGSVVGGGNITTEGNVGGAY